MAAELRRAAPLTLIHERCWSRLCAGFRQAGRGSSGDGSVRLTSSTVPARSWTPMAIRLSRGGCVDAESRTGGCLVSAPPPSGRSPDRACGAAPGRTTANAMTQRCVWCATSGVKASAVILIARIADNGPNDRALPGNAPLLKPSCVGRPGWLTGDRCGPGRWCLAEWCSRDRGEDTGRARSRPPVAGSRLTPRQLGALPPGGPVGAPSLTIGSVISIGDIA